MASISPSLAEVLYYAGNVFCIPLTLLINFLLFLYLLATFYTRRREARITLLIGCAFAGFAALVPFAHPNQNVYVHLNRVSEACSALTFLIQITILGRDINTKMRIKSLKLLTLLGEILTALLLGVSVAECVAAIVPSMDWGPLEVIDKTVLNFSLAFIFFFRFNLIVMSKGLLAVMRFGKAEIALYLLYVTSQYPFFLLNWWRGETWEPLEALWHRLTMLICLLHTVREKMRGRARNAAVNTKHSKARERTTRGAKVTATTGGGQEGEVPSREEVRPVGMIAGPSALVISASHRRISRQRSSVRPNLS